MVITAREHLGWCIQRAMEYYDCGDKTQAIASFCSDIGKHPDTTWIAAHPLLLSVTMEGVQKDRDGFMRCMSGWAI